MNEVTLVLGGGGVAGIAWMTGLMLGLQEQGAELLYWCQGRECGASSLWANSVFGNSTLYGSDDQQAYAMDQMKLFREAGVSPLGGCLPALLQIPIFFSLYAFFNS